MDVRVQTIPHAAQRYPTVGDWYFKHKGILKINVSELESVDYEFLVMIHELIEAYLCVQRGIQEEDVDKWDKSFAGGGEPGDDPAAPYHKEHNFALLVEKTLALELGVDWEEYNKYLIEFCDRSKGAWVSPE